MLKADNNQVDPEGCTYRSEYNLRCQEQRELLTGWTNEVDDPSHTAGAGGCGVGSHCFAL